ncbi:MAG TPA: hypothetical protein VGS12_12145 [Caulobacteraceae bacterium]|nr:hypothetical protein [Caulobacteraceae bacterium]
MKTLTAIVLIGAGLAFLAFMGWTLATSGIMGSLRGNSGVVIAIIVGGVVGVGGLTGLLMWLAFYSSRRGYDEPPRFGPRSRGEPQR